MRIRCRSKKGAKEAGQTVVLVALFLSLFLLAAIAFAVDMGSLWFSRQMAQGVADSACTAAAMDMLNAATGTSSTGGFTAGTNFSCGGTWDAAAPTSAPCVYASKNMDGGAASTLTAGTQGYDLHFTFPSSVSGLPTCTTGTGAPAMCNDPSALSNNFVQVNMDQRVPLFFSALLSGSTTTDVGAQATCGVIEANAPIPILVLDPTGSSLTGNGNIAISIVGGPQRSIQVNSNSGSAVSISGGGNQHIDLRLGGPNDNGSDFGVTGSEGPVSDFETANNGKWVDPAPAISDPFATVPAPVVPSAPAAPAGADAIAGCTSIPCAVAQGVHGCQDPAGCLLYTAGLYTSDIKSFKQTLIFDPGIYYMKGANLVAAANSCLRPGTGIGDGSGGTMFYFTGTTSADKDAGSVEVGANAGGYGICGTTTTVPLSTVKCINSGTGATVLPTNVVNNGGLEGDVLLAPCRQPTVSSVCGSNCSYNYGDPLGTADPLGEQRGMLFFEDRSANLVTSGNQPSWSGGGSFGISGIMYFHYCDSATGAGLGVNCQSAGYTDQLTLGGGSSGTTFVVGDIVTDQLNLHGNPAIEMDLNPNALYYVMKASLLQ